MAFDDLRQWIEHLRNEGELVDFKDEVDWNCEIGIITRKAGDIPPYPALLFDNIKDYQNTPATRVFTNSLRTHERIAMALDLPRHTPPLEILKEYRKRKKAPIKPVLVNTGPCKEVIKHGDEVDLYQFPVPQWNKWDGGRYMNTMGGVVTKDPESGWVNVGIYRQMICSKNSLVGIIMPSQHVGIHWTKYKNMGKPLPAAIALGWDQTLVLTGGTPTERGFCEYDFMGGLRRKPVELVKCETVDLEVPATAEIILEGEITTDPGQFQLEGPLGEATGYYGGASSPKPVFKINCITHRKDPILQGCVMGIPTTEERVLSQMSFASYYWDAIEDLGIPGIRGLWSPLGSVGQHVVVSLKTTQVKMAQVIASRLWSTSFALCWGLPKHVIVVDDAVFSPLGVEAAAAYVRRHGAERVDLAVPVMWEEVRQSAVAPFDSSIVAHVVRSAGDLGRFYRDHAVVSEQDRMRTIRVADEQNARVTGR